MEQIFDLPLHPLVVHFPAVAIPVLVLLTIWLAVRPAARRRYGLVVGGLAVVTTIATFVAASSGQALVDGSPFFTEETISDHKSLGETLRILVLLLTVAVLALVGLGRSRDVAPDGDTTDKGLNALALKDPIMSGLGGVAVVLALLAGVWTIRTGHEGAKSSWGSVFADDDDAGAEVEPEPEAAPAPTAEVAAEPEPTAEVEPDPEPEPTAEVEPEPEPDPEPAVVVDFEDPALVASGEAVFTTNCAGCHGADGAGTGRGPALASLAVVLPDPADHVAIVVDGVPPKMPGFSDTLTEDEINAVVAYSRATF